ncbi:hypothetical protein HMPREF6123_0289 [Oribacterium sinus F0268]|uniref:Uncharacterized protein n=1 Tax=Oribacterium sinus F0268 TaxID=585501 RepID=C2KUX0_9FIRM|nr:hypothetical protein HMPREF6123_0289 [Oribacterium sinus F0268]
MFYLPILLTYFIGFGIGFIKNLSFYPGIKETKSSCPKVPRIRLIF